jgi:HlyD family secretion protein
MLSASGHRQLRVQIEALDQQGGNLKEAIAADEARVKYLSEKVVTQQQLVNEGRLVRQTLINTITVRDGAEEQIRSRRTQLIEVDFRALQARSDLALSLQKSAFAVREVENDVKQLERALTAGAEVRSPYSGRIVEGGAEQGAMVNQGESLFTLDLTGRTVAALEALVYVPAKDGKRVAAGMVVQIAPATVRPEEFGYLLGKVTYVSDLPASARSMSRVLKNDSLVATLTGGTPPHEVHVDLLPDSIAESGYKWTTAKGPPMKIQSGTLGTAAIVIESRRPIEMVVPFFRKMSAM